MRRLPVGNRIACTVLALNVALASVAMAQEETTPKRSLASRIASLRLGWKTDESPEASKKSSNGNRPPAPASVAEGKSRTAATDSKTRSRLPRLSPRDLLPGELFSGKQKSRSTPVAQSRRQQRPTSQSISGATGSARTRMLRDLRNRTPGDVQQQSQATSSRAPSASQAARVASRNPSVNLDTTASEPPSPTVLPRRRSTRAGSVLSDPSDGGFAFSSSPASASNRTSPSRTASTNRNPSPLTAQPTETLDAAQLRRELLRFTPNGAAKKKVATREPSTRMPALSESALSGVSRSSKAEQAAKAALAKSVAADVAKEFASLENDSAKTAASRAMPEPTNKVADVVTPKAAAAKTPAVVTAPKAEPVRSKPAGRYAQESTAPSRTDRYGNRYGENLAAPAPKNAAKNAVPVIRKSPAAIAPAVVKTQPKKETPKELVVKSKVSESPQRLQMDLSPGATPVAPLSVSTGTQQGLRSSFGDSSFGERNSSYRSSAATKNLQEDPNDLLLTQKMPLIASRVSGPRQIVIGRKATYRVTIVNRGDASARQLLTTVDSPEWADIISTKTSNGTVEHHRTEGKLEWEIDQFAAKSTSTLDITLIARSGRPIELGVNWKHAPVSSSTLVEVQEPKLNIEVSGPDDVLFGKPQIYRLTLSNPGTGVAEGVVVQLLPPGKTPAEATSHSMGDLAAGESRSVELELTAREAGQLKLQANATAKGDVSAETLKELFCRKPGLEVDWRGPDQKYAGAAATYYFRVRNPGTAVAEAVSFVIDLPEGFKLSAASDGQYFDAAKRQVSWKVGSLRPGDDFYMELKGTPLQAGTNQFRFASATSDRLATAQAVAATEVIALADLKLEVRDPKGPIPVGTEAIYEVRVRNRGANTAKQIDVVALFSAGIEPQSVEGAECTIADGRVALRTIDRLEAGREVLVKIRARALQPGTHIFRTEVQCADLDIKLSADETTRFYADEPIDLGNDRSPRSASDADRFVYPR